MKRVYKYGTGRDIPDGAKYLCTQVEKNVVVSQGNDGLSTMKSTHNTLVWHYYEVEATHDDSGKP